MVESTRLQSDSDAQCIDDHDARGVVVSKRGAGFTLIDVLVSIAVIAVLLAFTSPSLRRVSEAARRVKCQKQLSDIGLALTMWADDHRDMLPPSDVSEEVFANQTESASLAQDVIQSSTLMEVAHLGADPNSFDGLGRLVQEDYLSDPTVLYDPSHDGDHPRSRYQTDWVTLGNEIVINYHYRLLPAGQMLSRLDPRMTIVSDGMRSVQDYNHRTGNNMLRVDMSVGWFLDENDYIESFLPVSEDAPGAGIPVFAAWTVLDTGAPPPAATGNGPPAGATSLLIPD